MTSLSSEFLKILLNINLSFERLAKNLLICMKKLAHKQETIFIEKRCEEGIHDMFYLFYYTKCG